MTLHFAGLAIGTREKTGQNYENTVKRRDVTLIFLRHICMSNHALLRPFDTCT